ncbi:hypothetical protein LWC34_00440 [Kibdelosporangium philippinense]|uniref:Ferredoxin n=2 Tax=Kibdelosporangium philippinense TaxID=211113 RepID=A0ABS8Z3F6_9PSEU|nr:hypothetical protein [Kibdelosporangium philippinense]MCE7001315.1 hypothetical protein [Kibdelosporangium philippinense]
MWAKAPAADVSSQTAVDRRGFLVDGLRPVECTACGTCVLVKKSSQHQMSIQWQTSTESCPEYASQNKPSALQDTCSKLRASIESLVAEGLLEVPDG